MKPVALSLNTQCRLPPSKLELKRRGWLLEAGSGRSWKVMVCSLRTRLAMFLIMTECRAAYSLYRASGSSSIGNGYKCNLTS